MATVRHGSLNLPGYWRLAWFGKLEQVPSHHAPPRIRVYLWELPRWPDREAGRREVRLINVGEIPLLYLNVVVHDGVALPLEANPWTRRSTLPLDLSRDNLRVFKRFDSDKHGNAIIPIKTDYLADDPEANTLFVAVGSAGDPYSVLIPCVEVFRFFYALSSRLANAALSDAFLDPDRYLWDVKESKVVSEQRFAFLKLRKRMHDDDVLHLAMYAFNEVALSRAQEIYRYLSNFTLSEGNERAIRALPPFDGRLRIKADVVNLPTARFSRTLITRLVSCDWRLPFDRIDHVRENDGRASADADQNRPLSGWSRAHRTQEPGADDVTLVDGPGSNSLAPWELPSEEISSRFPLLANVKIHKRPTGPSRTRSGGRSSAVLPPRPAPTRATTGELISAAEMIPEARVTGPRRFVPSKVEIDELADPTSGDAAYLKTAALLLEMQQHQLAVVRFMAVTQKIAYWRSVVLNVSPVSRDEESSSWIFVDASRTKPRLALIAAIQHEGRVRYLIDFQRKRPRECSMLVLWGTDEKELPVSYLNSAMAVCRQARQVSLESLAHLAIAWTRVRHTVSTRDADGPNRLLQKLFVAESSANKP